MFVAFSMLMYKRIIFGFVAQFLLLDIYIISKLYYYKCWYGSQYDFDMHFSSG